MPLQALFRWLLPKDDRFFKLFEDQAAVIAEAARQMLEFPSTDGGKTHDVLEKIHRLEHRGDDLVREAMLALDETYVTPIDREDIHALATALDNVLDYTYSAAQCCVTHEVRELTKGMRELLQLLTESTEVLHKTVPSIRQHQLDQLAPARLQIVAIEKRGDAIYQGEIAALFKNPAVDAKEILRQQAVLDALEEALDSCQDAADLLENIAIKHA
jgi:predicted phosphate transport protein (TIGR00153 family)